MLRYSYNIALSCVLVGVGFLLPFWPLCFFGVLLAGFSGRWVTAILLGLLIDVAFGVPIGVLHVVYAPFTVLALVSSGAYMYLARYVRRSSSDTL